MSDGEADFVRARLDVAALRRQAESEAGVYGFSSVLALLDVAEAAQAFNECGPDYGGQFCGDFTGYMRDFDAASARLAEALTRFDFGVSGERTPSAPDGETKP